jgi:ABC-type transport system substrate-binding protein
MLPQLASCFPSLDSDMIPEIQRRGRSDGDFDDQHVPQNTLQSIVPDLAAGWSWNEDGTELTFRPRQGVRWHDGQPFTASDIKCTWDMLLGRSASKFRINPRKSWYWNLDCKHNHLTGKTPYKFESSSLPQRITQKNTRSFHVMSNKRIKLRFGVAVALVIVGGY